LRFGGVRAISHKNAEKTAKPASILDAAAPSVTQLYLDLPHEAQSQASSRKTRHPRRFRGQSAIAPAKAPKRLFLWYMDFDAVERNRALKHNRSSSFTELYLRESHIGEP
jgi:hypothetical protein